jgi:hypothetical protein
MTSDKTLAKLERTLDKLSKQQDALCDEVAGLSRRVDALASGQPVAPDVQEVITFLDQFRAGEALGELSVGAWIEVCQVDCLRGGLRTVQQREGFHARLLAERIKELGAAPSFELPDAIQDAAMQDAGSQDKTDAAKVLAFVERFGNVDEALAPIDDWVARLEGDPETQFLLKTIRQDECSTLEFFHEACALLNPS